MITTGTKCQKVETHHSEGLK